MDLTSRGRIEMKMWMESFFPSNEFENSRSCLNMRENSKSLILQPSLSLLKLALFQEISLSLIIEARTIPTDVLIIPTIPDSLNLPSKELKIQNCASPFKVYTSKKNPISWTRHMLNHWIWNPDITIFP